MPDQDDDRREFRKTCGKFAVVTPPAITPCFRPLSPAQPSPIPAAAWCTIAATMVGTMVAETAVLTARTTGAVEVLLVRPRAWTDWPMG